MLKMAQGKKDLSIYLLRIISNLCPSKHERLDFIYYYNDKMPFLYIYLCYGE
jgi:hypothetical protein